MLARPQSRSWQCLVVFCFSLFLTGWTRGSLINRPSSCSVLYYTTAPTAHSVQNLRYQTIPHTLPNMAEGLSLRVGRQSPE
ncbi:hypothetical protein IW262DRAFT_1412393 [Armillaria fumosa]|nr:hypothetical protein IW262DRAFT_1412393 [Armillaria fumosa]